MRLPSLGTFETQILVLFQKYDEDRRSAADALLKAAQKLYKLLVKAQCLMFSYQST